MNRAATTTYHLEEEAMDITRREGRACARVYRYPGVAAVLGRGGKSDLELNSDRLGDADVPVLRRRGGGCAVVLDPGNLVVSVTLPLPGIGRITSSFREISNWMIDVLATCGIPGVERKGVSDLVLGDRKIGGSCIYRSRDLLHYSTTLLVDADLDLMERYLPHPPREPEYRRGRRHRDFVTTLRECELVEDMNAFEERLTEEVRLRLPGLTQGVIGGAASNESHRVESAAAGFTH